MKMPDDLSVRVNIRKIADNFSQEEIVGHVCEELAEACAALIQYDRVVSGEKKEDLRECEGHALEELADVLVMVEQLFHKSPYMRERVSNWMKLKIERTFRRYKIEGMVPMEGK